MPEKRNVSRRSFLKTTGIACGAIGAGVTGSALAFGEPDDGTTKKEVKEFNGVCRSNCNFACRYTANVVDGKLVKLEPAEYEEAEYTGCCLKGISYPERVYGPKRIKYPMRRVGERGAGEWERISWDEALQELADNITKYTEESGPASIFLDRASGSFGTLTSGTLGIWNRLAYCHGMTAPAYCADYAAGVGIHRVLGTGDWYYTSEPSNVLDSDMIVIWGSNPVYTAPQMWRFTQRSKENGADVVVIDPVRSATAHKATQYIQCIPGNDGYMALAMSNYVLENDLQDKEYMAEHTTGAFLVREDTSLHLRKSDFETLEEGAADDFYVWDKAKNTAVLIGDAEDPAYEGSFEYEGIKVSPAFGVLREHLKQYTLEDAEAVTSVPVETMKKLAEDFCSKKTTVNLTYGTDHYVNGYHTSHAIATLMILTGNFGKPGTGFTGVWVREAIENVSGLWVGPSVKGSARNMSSISMHDIFRDQALFGTPYPAKAMISICANSVSNLGGQNNFFNDILPNLEFWAVVDYEFTDSTNYCDLILPCASWYEEEDYYRPYCMPYTVLQEKAIEPLYEARAEYDFVPELARMLGYTADFPEDYTFDDWASIALDSEPNKAMGINLESLRENKYMRSTYPVGDHFVRGIDTPIPTESGRAQLYCEIPITRLDAGQELPDYDKQRLPRFVEPNEASKNNELFKKYPLVFMQEHSRFRVHSQWYAVPCLREIDPEPLARVNSIDAAARGIESGDTVEVFNDRGHAVLHCVVDESIAPGVLSIPKGWQRESFIEGCFQEMTNDTVDPYSLNFGFYDTLVDVRKY